MKYIEVTFTCCPFNEIVSEVLSGTLCEIDFESFVDTDFGLKAYIQSSLFNEDSLRNILENFPLEVTFDYQILEIEDKNWNEEWEKNYFKPLVIDDKCIVRSTFHEVEGDYEYNVFIDPKMAFGTGHHQTTELVMREVLDMDLQGKSVLDMGCGTAILAILASKRGANPILAIDIDNWAYDNALENLNLNKVENVELKIGGAELLTPDLSFDVILANINRNILLNDICKYVTVLESKGSLYMSGFYEEDIPVIKAECDKYGLVLAHYNIKDNWAVVKFLK